MVQMSQMQQAKSQFQAAARTWQCEQAQFSGLAWHVLVPQLDFDALCVCVYVCVNVTVCLCLCTCMCSFFTVREHESRQY